MYGLREVFWSEGLEGAKKIPPSHFPAFDQHRFGFLLGHYELAVSIAVLIVLSTGGESCPWSPHTTRHVLHEHGDAVRFDIKRGKQIMLLDLRQRPFGQRLQAVELAQRIVQILRSEPI